MYADAVCWALSQAGSSDGTVAITPTPLPLGEWSHVAVTFDGSALRVVVNGAEAASCPVVAFTPTDATTPCRIGGGCVRYVGVVGAAACCTDVRDLTLCQCPTRHLGCGLRCPATSPSLGSMASSPKFGLGTVRCHPRSSRRKAACGCAAVSLACWVAGACSRWTT